MDADATLRFDVADLEPPERRGEAPAPVPEAPEERMDPGLEWSTPVDTPAPEAAGTGRRLKSMSSALLEVELHFLYEQYREAASLLERLIQRDLESETPDMRPWSMLFSVYRQQRDRESFDRVAGQFREHYNVIPPAWDAVPPAPQSTGLEARYPRVLDRIAEIWQDPDGARLLNGLLLDDRGGIRRGFELDVAEDISFLRDLHLLRTELA
jgi:hypothetical protein